MNRQAPSSALCGLRAGRFWACLVVLASLVGCGATPQLGGEEALGAADALWTAVTARRTDLVDQAAADCQKLRDAGQLSEEAAEVLQEVIRQARAGQWESAAEDLKAFIQGQRPATEPPTAGPAETKGS